MVATHRCARKLGVDPVAVDNAVGVKSSRALRDEAGSIEGRSV